MPHTSPFSSAMPHAGQPQGPLARDLFAQLRRRFEPMLSLAVAHASADGERDYEKLSGIMAQLCDKEEREPSVLAQNQLEACRLAAYALVDEILLGLPQSGWFAHGLQLQRLGRTDGGNAFYAALFAMLTEALETESRDADILLMHPVYKNPDRSHAPAGLTGLAGHAVHDTRDIAHAKLKARLDAGEDLPQYFKDHPVLYAGPAKTPEGMPCGSMGPTTANRMDPYVDEFQDHGGSMVMIAKGNRTQVVTDACKKHGGFYLGSIGGPAAVLSMNSIKSIECVEYPELGMEAIWKINVVDFPAFILVDDKGNDFFKQLKPWTPSCK